VLVDVTFSEHRDLAAAQAFFQSAKTVTDVTPDRVTTDGHDSYPRAIRTKLGEGVNAPTATSTIDWSRITVDQGSIPADAWVQMPTIG
jgi:transposase-like protein